MNIIPMSLQFFVLLALVILACSHSPTTLVHGAIISLHLAQMSLQYWIMPRNIQSCLTFCSGVKAVILFVEQTNSIIAKNRFSLFVDKIVILLLQTGQQIAKIVHFLFVYLLGQKLGKMRFPGNCKNQKNQKSNSQGRNSSLTIAFFIFYNSQGIAELIGNPMNQNVSVSFSCGPERIHNFSDTF